MLGVMVDETALEMSLINELVRSSQGRKEALEGHDNRVFLDARELAAMRSVESERKRRSVKRRERRAQEQL